MKAYGKKKILSLLLTGSMLLSLLLGSQSAAAAGGEETAGSGEEIEIEFGVYETDNYTAEVWQSIMDAYEAAHPGVKIKKVLEAGGSDDQTFWKTLLSSGNLPDVLVSTGGLESLDGAFAEVPQDILDLFEDSGICMNNGKYVTVPMSKQYRMQCYYHKDEFEELGLEEPQTWDEFIDLCEQIKAAGKVPMMCGGTGDVWATGEPYWICVGNGALLSEYPDFNQQLREGKVKLNNPTTLEIMNTWQDMIEKGYYYEGVMSFSYPQGAQAFQDDEAVMMMDGSWVATTMDADGRDDIGVFAVPLMDGSKTYAVKYDYWGVAETSEHKETAFDFIRFIAGENADVYKTYLSADGLYSATKEPVTYEQGPVMTKFMENISDWEPAIEVLKCVGEYGVPSGLSSFICKSFQNIFNGADVEAEVETWDAEYQRLLDAQ